MAGFQFGAPTIATTTASPFALTTGDNISSGTSGNVPSTDTTTGTASHPQQSSSVLEIPCLEHEFPNLAVHFQLESIFEALRDPSLSLTDQMLQGQELFHLVGALCRGGTDTTDTTRDDSTLYSQSVRRGYNLSEPRPFSPSGSHYLNHTTTGSHDNNSLPQGQRLPTHILLPERQSSLPTPLPTSILDTIGSISKYLRVSLAQAGALYGSCILDALDPTTLGSDTSSWFEKRQLRPWTAQGFVETCLEKFQRDKCYVPPLQDVSDKKQEAIIMAMNLYFLERGCQLETILMIMQYRISALQALLDCSKSGSSNCSSHPDTSSRSQFDEQGANHQTILQATNQLLEAGLVSNLVKLVRELTLVNEELKRKICVNLQEYEKNVNDRGHTERGFMNNNSSFNMMSSNANDGTSMSITDADYAMYEFTLQQRHIACRCLFYLMYHTQCTVGEVTDVIDLIDNLTNGDSSLGMASGLSLLDPVRDVPDPYIVRWRKSDEGSDKSSDGMQHPVSMTPQQIKFMKDHRDWKEELSANLWSVRGLSQATVTTTHTDFSGQIMYHSLTVGELHNRRGVEVVDGGKPQLMQCVTVLILTVMTVFVCANDIVNRNVKDEIQIENGNALNIDSNIHTVNQMLKPLVDRLGPSSQKFSSWKRRDIIGLLSASFGLLLNDMVVTSASQMCRSGEESELKLLLQSCLEVSTIEKSITFARVSLLSCIDAVSIKGPLSTLRNDFEFYISVLTDFSAHFLDAICSFRDLPISRRKWLTFEEDELQLRQVQAQQRKQLEEWSGKAYNERKLPEEVDVSRRPDCIDDIVALAVSVCSTCPVSSQKFWSICCTDEDDDKGGVIYQLKPTRIMKRLEKSQAKDSSLAPVYVAFLSVLALADDPNGCESGNSGADAIFDWLRNNNRLKSSPTSYDPTSQINWNYILYWLDWFQEQFSPQSQSGWGNEISQSEGSTSYYYGSDDWDNPYKSNVSNNLNNAKDPSLNASNQKVDVDSWTKMLLLSYLSLISHVVLRSYRCRKEILELKLTKSQSSHILAKDEDIITIFFNLLSKPISPDARGLTFTTIANLVRQRPNEKQTVDEKKKSDDIVLKCWELLESSQILPIVKLSQYSPIQGSAMPTFTRSQSKTEMVNWFPPDEQYGIIYEMEYVESKAGSYPSTEGFLKLLTSLFSCDVCPHSLGSSWRPQSGCSPYVEYVIDFVLPRILDSHRDEVKLHFASEIDKCRLVARALEVIDTILIRYVPPTLSTIEGLDKTEFASDKILRLSIERNDEEDNAEGVCNVFRRDMTLINRSIFPTKIHRENSKQVEMDFYVDNFQFSQDPNDLQNQRAPRETIPRAKSPGYYILVDLLSSNGLLFDRLTELLFELGSKSESINTELLNVSLYGEYSPSYQLAKTGRDYIIDVLRSSVSGLSVENLDSDLAQLFAKDLLLVQTENVNDDPLLNVDGTIMANSKTSIWKDFCILLALRILCAAAAREDSFVAVSRALQNRFTVVPVLRFNTREVGVTKPLFVKNFRIDLLSKRLLEKMYASSSQTADLFLAVLFHFVGYQSQSLKSGNAIASMATSVINFLTLSSSLRDFASALSVLQPSSRIETSAHLSSRLSLISLRKDDLNESSLVEELLKLILFHLRPDDCAEHNLALVVLGLSELTAENRKSYLWRSIQGFNVDICNYRNSLDVILDLLSNGDFVLNVKTSKLAVRCFEIMFRLCELSGKTTYDSIYGCVMNKLRKSNFWETRLLQLVSVSGHSDSPFVMAAFQSPLNNESLYKEDSTNIIERDNNIIQSVSWLLKGVAYELHFLSGYLVGTQNRNGTADIPTSFPQPLQYRHVIELLLGCKCNLLFNTLINLPLAKPRYLSRELLLKKPPGMRVPSMTLECSGQDDIYGECSVIDISNIFEPFVESKMHRISGALTPHDDVMMWGELWNSYVKCAYASSHITKSWAVLCSTVFTSCREILLTSFNDDEPSPYNGDTALKLLTSILTLFAGGQDHGKSIMTNCFDKLSLFTLSTSCIPLVEFIFDLYHNSIDEADICVSLQDISSLIELFLDAIVGCASDDKYSDEVTEEIVAVFATILSYILESILVKTAMGVTNSSQDDIFCEKAAAALLILTQLSLRSTNQRREAHHDTLSIHDMATYGSTSLFHLLEGYVQADADVEQTVLFQMFHETPESSLLSKIIGKIGACEEAVMRLLQTIACCKGGADLLIQKGVIEEVIKVSLEHVGKAAGARNDTISARLYCPKIISCHVTLLNTLMSVDISHHFHYRLLLGVSKYVQIHLGLIKELIDQFPLNHTLLHDFMAIISLVTSYTHEGSIIQVDTFFEISHLYELDKVVCQFAINVSEYPLPGFVIPVLPSHLRRMAQDRSWWEKIPHIINNSSVSHFDSAVLPNLPETDGNDYVDQPWTVRMYRYACNAASCLDTSLTYLINRFAPVTDLGSLAVALYRCVETSCEVKKRLEYLTMSNDNLNGGIMHPIDYDYIENNDSVHGLSRKREIDSLQTFGASLASCVFKLLQVTKLNIDRILHISKTQMEINSFDNTSTSCHCIISVLKNVDIRTAVRGARMLDNDEVLMEIFNTNIHDSLIGLNTICGRNQKY
eukprot:CAMPEP_0176484866 /NCGR_PEP_ID=MMETSP0200_2-20121128/4716_1 /TAXON_ID=947934 /ORGANISM="Chaetoceros sp., Strain GSL56" /LENGTH=2592 /DNA_ID=CAMNT_0017881435 /DNA_START=156 /DNA_END=7934 /DNA_ORIENTATION=+